MPPMPITMPYPAPAGNTFKPFDEDMLQDSAIQTIKQHVRNTCQREIKENSDILTTRLLRYAYHVDMDLHNTHVSHTV